MKLKKITTSDFILLTAIGLRVASTATADLSFFVIAFYALKGRAYAVLALALSWFFSMLNSGIAPVGGMASIGRYAVIACAAIGVLSHPRHTKNQISIVTLLFGAFIVVHSLSFSSFPDVSISKALVWATAMATLSAAWHGLLPVERDALIQRIFGGLTFVLLASLPLLFLSLGYKVNGTGFQGILGHPQEFGVTMALLSIWYVGKILARRDPPWSLLVLFVLCCVLVVLSEARTGAFSILFGASIAVLVSPRFSGRPLTYLFPGLRNSKVMFLIAIIFLGAIIAGPMFTEKMSDFVTKRTAASTFMQAYEYSRGSMMDAMWANIKEKPIEGIGFGIASIPMDMRIIRDPVLNLPVSAIVEKGVLPLAVLEEIGLIGFMFFAVWLSMLLYRSAYGGFLPLALVLTSLFINMGECTLFSASGMGMMLLVLLGWASSFTASRKPLRR